MTGSRARRDAVLNGVDAVEVADAGRADAYRTARGGPSDHRTFDAMERPCASHQAIKQPHLHHLTRRHRALVVSQYQ